MSKKEVADTLAEIQLHLTKELLARIQSGTATSADLNIARQLLKDNNIDAVPSQDNGLERLGRILPFDRDSLEQASKRTADKQG